MSAFYLWCAEAMRVARTQRDSTQKTQIRTGSLSCRSVALETKPPIRAAAIKERVSTLRLTFPRKECLRPSIGPLDRHLPPLVAAPKLLE